VLWSCLDNQLGALELLGQPTGRFEVAWTTNWALWSCLDNQLGALVELPGQPTGCFGVAWTTNWVLWSCLDNQLGALELVHKLVQDVDVD